MCYILSIKKVLIYYFGQSKQDTCGVRHCDGVARSNPVICSFTLNCFAPLPMTKRIIRLNEGYIFEETVYSQNNSNNEQI
jgi:hypothetical protein